ncbi:hypothetical protein ADUPG1_007285, partial [Aduncisulcus paluster]
VSACSSTAPVDSDGDISIIHRGSATFVINSGICGDTVTIEAPLASATTISSSTAIQAYSLLSIDVHAALSITPAISANSRISLTSGTSIIMSETGSVSGSTADVSDITVGADSTLRVSIGASGSASLTVTSTQANTTITFPEAVVVGDTFTIAGSPSVEFSDTVNTGVAMFNVASLEVTGGITSTSTMGITATGAIIGSTYYGASVTIVGSSIVANEVKSDYGETSITCSGSTGIVVPNITSASDVLLSSAIINILTNLKIDNISDLNVLSKTSVFIGNITDNASGNGIGDISINPPSSSTLRPIVSLVSVCDASSIDVLGSTVSIPELTITGDIALTATTELNITGGLSSSNGTVTLNSSGDCTIGSITSGDVTITSTGTLSRNSSITDPITIDTGGTLSISSSIIDCAACNLDAGDAENTNTFSVAATSGALSVGVVTVSDQTTQTMSSQGNLTINGTLTISMGTFTISAPDNSSVTFYGNVEGSGSTLNIQNKNNLKSDSTIKVNTFSAVLQSVGTISGGYGPSFDGLATLSVTTTGSIDVNGLS